MFNTRQNLFFERFLSSQIHDDWGAFSAKITSCAVRYDVIYHPFPINSQNMGMLEVDSPGGL